MTRLNTFLKWQITVVFFMLLMGCGSNKVLTIGNADKRLYATLDTGGWLNLTDYHP
jgi:hypothetical protein